MNQIYRVARGMIRRPRKQAGNQALIRSADYIKQGEVIPEGLLAPEEVASLLLSGAIELLPSTPENQQAARTVKSRGKWSVDPAMLAGKSLEELVIMILEIDPEHIIEGVDLQYAIRLLTSEWDPAFRETIAASSDRTAPARFSPEVGVKPGEVKQMSDKAAAGLAKAREMAQAADPKQD